MLWDGQGRDLRHLTDAQAAQMVKTGKAQWACKECLTTNIFKRGCTGGAKKHDFQLCSTDTMASGAPDSDAALTFSAMLANVGLSRRDERGHAIKQGQEVRTAEKVAMWAFEFDDKAPRVGPRVTQEMQASAYSKLCSA